MLKRPIPEFESQSGGRAFSPYPRWLLVVVVVFSLAPLGGCASSSYLQVRKAPHNPLAGPLRLFSRRGPKPTDRTQLVLRRYDLEETQEDDPGAALRMLQEQLAAEPDIDKMYAFAELAYIEGKKTHLRGDEATAMDLFSASVSHAYLYLFGPQFDGVRNPYDPQFRKACDLYNTALEELLRSIDARGQLRPGETFTLQIGKQHVDIRVAVSGLWDQDAFEKFEFVSDYEVQGLTNRHVTYGLGVPMIAVHKEASRRSGAGLFYPRGMSVPVTAILRATQEPCRHPGETRHVACALELHDPSHYNHVQIAGRLVPLETDLTTPLGYFLDNPEFQGSELATWGLLRPYLADDQRGLYMLEAYDPRKIPVLMVHGLWSSPETWTEMVNDLRSLPEIRNRYQFWTYLYPTGEPFWISAREMRDDLVEVRETIDPQRQYRTLDQTVLIGHSMGGLVSRLQTLESDDDYWRILSDAPFDELQADDATRETISKTLFFHPNRSIRRVVTIGTPHRGSEFSNDYTRWLGRKLIQLPSTLMRTRAQIARDNPNLFRSTDLLTITTSIDSLAPDSPILPVMLESEKPTWVKYHNVVGVVSDKQWLGRVSERGDGVVTFESAHLDDVQSEIVVDADHVHVHQHPRTILEVRRILLEHSQEMYAEVQKERAMYAEAEGQSADYAGYRIPPPESPAGGSPAGQPRVQTSAGCQPTRAASGNASSTIRFRVDDGHNHAASDTTKY
jgi:pimeloyl-ACP methyl ester carboxylesterase